MNQLMNLDMRDIYTHAQCLEMEAEETAKELEALRARVKELEEQLNAIR